jgi:hypothetical protein
MFETSVIGNKEWTKGFLCDTDVGDLEAFDSEMRSRELSNTPGEARSYEQLFDEDGGKVSTHCEHGIPFNENCGKCEDIVG